LRSDDTVGPLVSDGHFGGDGVRLVLHVQHGVLGHPGHAAEEHLGGALGQFRTTGDFRVESLDPPIVQRQHVVLHGFDEEEALELGEFFGVLGGQVMGLGPVVVNVVELPHIVVEGGESGPEQPGDGVAGHRHPAFVVHPAIADHLEVLGLPPIGRLGVVEQIGHGDSVEWKLLDSVDEGGLWDTEHIEDGGGDVDDVVELVAHLTFALETTRPVDHRAITRPSEVGGHLLGPLIRGAHGVGPPNGVVVVGGGSAELVDVGGQEFGSLEGGGPVGRQHLVEGPVGRAQGINQLQAQYVKEYGPGNYIPNVFIQYWGMRVMAYLAALIGLFALWGLWLIRRKTLGKAKWFLLIAPWFAIAPFLMNTAGWLLTESGRQPWIVQGR
jgi:hypothetical protein